MNSTRKPHEKTPRENPRGIGVLQYFSCDRLANDRAAVFGDDHFDALATSKLVGQDFATKEALFPADKARDFTSAARGQTSRNRVRAMRARIDNTPACLDWRRCAANWWCTANGCGSTARRRAAVTCGSNRGGGNGQSDRDNAAHQKFSKHLNALPVLEKKLSGRTERLPRLMASLAYPKAHVGYFGTQV